MATFVGNANILKGTVDRRGKGLFPCGGKALAEQEGNRLAGRRGNMAVRSENISWMTPVAGHKALVGKSFSAGQLRLALKMEDGKE